MTDGVDRYGLSAYYEFVPQGNSLRSMGAVRRELEAIEQAVENMNRSMSSSNFTSVIQDQMQQSSRANRRTVREIDSVEDAFKQAQKRIKPLRREFKALRAEIRNVDFGDIADDRQFRRASREVRDYVLRLRELEGQVTENSAAERAFVASLKSQQKIMASRLEMQSQQRIAAKSAYRAGEFQALQGVSNAALTPLIKEAKEGIGIFAKFDDTMSSVAAISEATGKDLESLRQKAKQLGATTRYTSSQAAEAEAALASAGFRTSQILASVGATLNLASAGALDLEEAANIGAKTTAGLGLKVEDLGHVTDTLAYAAAAANTNIQELGLAMSYAAPPAKLFGATVDETAALMGVMSNAAISSDKAGTAMRSALLRLAKPPKAAAAALSEFNIVTTDASGNMKNVIELFEEISATLQIDPAALKSIRDAGDDVEKLAIVSQSKQLGALKDIFGTEGMSGAAAALSQIKELKRLSLASAASSGDVEQLTYFLTEIQGLKLEKGEDVFSALIRVAPSYSKALEIVNQANAELLRTNLRSLNQNDYQTLINYLYETRGIVIQPGQDVFSAVAAQAPNTQNAINQVTNALDTLGIALAHQRGAAIKMADVMEDNLAGSFRSLSSAWEAVQINLIEPLTPLIRWATKALTKFFLFIANLPAPVRTLISVGLALTAAMAALGVVVGASGVLLFTFSQAASTASVASASLAAGLIPLTGFFQTSMTAIVATNPIETFLRNSQRLVLDFQESLTATTGETTSGLRVLTRQLSSTSRAFVLFSRSVAFSPLGIGLVTLFVLNDVLEQLIPGFNLLGVALATLAAPVGFVYGVFKGLVKSIFEALSIIGGDTFAVIASPFADIVTAVQMAINSFVRFSQKGEEVGMIIGRAIVLPIQLASNAIKFIWNTAIDLISRPLRPFAKLVQFIGQLLVALLGEDLHLADLLILPLLQINQAWMGFINNFGKNLMLLVQPALSVAQQLINALNHNPTVKIPASWAGATEQIGGSIQELVGPAQQVGDQLNDALKPKDFGFDSIIEQLNILSFTFESKLNFKEKIIAGWQSAYNFLTDLFQKIINFSQLVNQAFLGIGNVTSEQREAARESLVDGTIATLMQVLRLLGSAVKAIGSYQKLQKQLIAGVEQYFDFFSFTLLTLSSLPLTLLYQLEETAATIIPELATILESGIPRAIIYALPGLVAIATSTGLIKGFEQGLSQALDQIPISMKNFLDSIYSRLDEDLKVQLNKTVNRALQDFAINLPGLFPNGLSYVFNIDKLYKEFNEFITGTLTSFINYLHKVGEVSNQVGQELYAMIKPIVMFTLHPALPPIIPFFATIIPMRQAIVELYKSPALRGLVSFLLTTVIPETFRTLNAVAQMLVFTFDAIVTLPLAAFFEEIRSRAKPVGTLFNLILQQVNLLKFAIRNFVVEGLMSLSTAVTRFLLEIPYVGKYLAAAFGFSINFAIKLVDILMASLPRYFRMLATSFKPVKSAFVAMLGGWKKILQETLQGLLYVLRKGLKPIAAALGKLLDPTAAFKFIGFYLKTGGLKGVIKSGALNFAGAFNLLNYISPLDLFFGSAKKLTKVLRVGLDTIFPIDLIEAKQKQIFKSLASAEDIYQFMGRRNRLVPLVNILKNLDPELKVLVELVRGLMLISPTIQIIGRLSITFMAWYAILKPLNKEMLAAIANTKVFGFKLTPLARVLAVMRFLVVDLGDAFAAFAKKLPGYFEVLKQLYLGLSAMVKAIVHEAAGISSILINIFKFTVVNPIGLALAAMLSSIDLLLIGIRKGLIFVLEKTWQYGDALVALSHGRVMPLIKQIASDIWGTISFLFNQTIVRIVRLLGKALHLVNSLIRATFEEIGRLIAHPIKETRRLAGIASRYISQTMGQLWDQFMVYARQLQLDKFFNLIITGIKNFWPELLVVAGIIARILGFLSPLGFALITLAELGAFLAYEYTTGFNELAKIISSLNHPIEALNTLIKSIIAFLGVYVPPDMTEMIASFVEGFVKSLPLIAGGIFFIALLIKRSIGGAFQVVSEGVMTFIRRILQVAQATNSITSAVGDRVQLLVGQTSSAVRGRPKVGPLSNPLAYSTDPEYQAQASALAQQKIQKQGAILKYQKELDRLEKENKRFAEKEILAAARTNKSYSDEKARYYIDDPVTGSRVGLSGKIVEKKRNFWGAEKYELTDLGKQFAEQQRRKMLDFRKGSTEDDKEVLRQAAKKSGLEDTFTKYLPPGQKMTDADLIKLAAKTSAETLETKFTSAIKNIHVQTVEADRLFISHSDIPTAETKVAKGVPVNSLAFEMQLEKFRQKSNAFIFRNAQPLSDIRLESIKAFGRLGVGASAQAAEDIKVVLDKLKNMIPSGTQNPDIFRQVELDPQIKKFTEEVERLAKRLAQFEPPSMPANFDPEKILPREQFKADLKNIPLPTHHWDKSDPVMRAAAEAFEEMQYAEAVAKKMGGKQGNVKAFVRELDKFLQQVAQFQGSVLELQDKAFADFTEVNQKAAKAEKQIKSVLQGTEAVPTTVGGVLVQALKRLVFSSQEAADEISATATTAKTSFLHNLYQATGIPGFIEKLRFDKSIARQARIVQNRIERINSQNQQISNEAREMRERGLKNLARNQGKQYDEMFSLFTDPKQLEFFRHFLQKGQLKRQVGFNEIGNLVDGFLKTNIKGGGGNFIFKDNKGVDLAPDKIMENIAKRLRESPVMDQQLRQDLRAFFKSGEGNFKGQVPEARMLKMMDALQHDSVFGGGFTKTMLTNLRNSLQSRQEFAQIWEQFLYHGKMEVIASEDQRKDIANVLGVTESQLKNLHKQQLKSPYEALKQSVEDWSHGISKGIDKTQDSVNSNITNLQRQIEDLPVVGLFIDTNLSAKMVRPLHQLNEYIFNTIRGVKAGIEQTIIDNYKVVEFAFKAFKLPKRINQLNREYQQMRENSLDYLLKEGKGDAPKTKGRLQVNLFKALKAEGIGDRTKQDQALLALLQDRSRTLNDGTVVRMSIMDKLKEKGSKIDEKEIDGILRAYQKALGLMGDVGAKRIENLVHDNRYTAAATKPIQLLIAQYLPSIYRDFVDDFKTIGKVIKHIDSKIGLSAAVNFVIKDIGATFLSKPVLSRIYQSIANFRDKASNAINGIALGIERVVGPNFVSKAVRGVARFIANSANSTLKMLDEISAKSGTQTWGMKIISATQQLYTNVISTMQQATARVRNAGIWTSITKFFGGIRKFFGDLFSGIKAGGETQKQLQEANKQIPESRAAIRKANKQAAALEREIQAQQQQVGTTKSLARIESEIKRQEAKLARYQRIMQANPRSKSTPGNVAATQKELDQLRQQKDSHNKLQQLQQERDRQLTVRQTEIDKLAAAKEKQGQIIGKGKPWQANLAQSLAKTMDSLSQKAAKKAQSLRQAKYKTVGGIKSAPGYITEKTIEGRPNKRWFRNKLYEKQVFITPKLWQGIADFTERAARGAKAVSDHFNQSAQQSTQAWQTASTKIQESAWEKMVKRAKRVGKKLQAYLSEASPGPSYQTRQNWETTEHSVSGNMEQMAQTAHHAGAEIQQEMQHSAKASQKAFGQFGNFAKGMWNSIGGIGRTGMAVGGLLSAGSFAFQTLSYSLGTIGLIDEETSEKLYKFTELLTMVGAVGGLAAPIIGVLASTIGTLGTIVMTAGTGITALGSALAAITGLGSVAFAPVLLGLGAVVLAVGGLFLAFKTNFLGIRDLAASLGSALVNLLSGPIAWIENAWQGFVDRFGSKLMPIVQPAIDIAQKLINALNHNPTEKIPASWAGAAEQISGSIQGLVEPAQKVGNQLGKSLQSSLDTGIAVASSVGSAAQNAVAFLIQAILERVNQIAAFFEQLNSTVASLAAKIEKGFIDLGGKIEKNSSSIWDTIGIALLGKAIALGLSLFTLFNRFKALNLLLKDLAKPIENLVGLLKKEVQQKDKKDLAMSALRGGSNIGKKLRPVAPYLPALGMIAPDLSMAGTGLVTLSYVMEELLPVVTAIASFLPMIGGIAAGVGAFILVLEVATKKINVLGTIIGSVAFVLQMFIGIFHGIGKAVKEVLDRIGYFKDLSNTIKRMAEAGKKFGESFGYNLTMALLDPLGVIKKAWMGFVKWFSELPLVSFALKIGQGLINALNHNPTIVIPASWARAVWYIQDLLSGLSIFAKGVGIALIGILAVVGGFVVFQGVASILGAIAAVSFAPLIVGLTAVAAVAGAVYLAFKNNFLGINDLISNFWQKAQVKKEQLIAGVKDKKEQLIAGVKDKKEQLIAGVKGGWEKGREVAGSIKGKASAVVDLPVAIEGLTQLMDLRLSTLIAEVQGISAKMDAPKAEVVTQTAIATIAASKQTKIQQLQERKLGDEEIAKKVGGWSILPAFNKEKAFQSAIEDRIKIREARLTSQIQEGLGSDSLLVRQKYAGMMVDGQLTESGQAYIESSIAKEIKKGEGLFSKENLTQIAQSVGLAKRLEAKGIGVDQGTLSSIAIKGQSSLTQAVGAVETKSEQLMALEQIVANTAKLNEVVTQMTLLLMAVNHLASVALLTTPQLPQPRLSLVSETVKSVKPTLKQRTNALVEAKSQQVGQFLQSKAGEAGNFVKDTAIPAVGSFLQTKAGEAGNFIKDAAIPAVGSFLQAKAGDAGNFIKENVHAKSAVRSDVSGVEQLKEISNYVPPVSGIPVTPKHQWLKSAGQAISNTWQTAAPVIGEKLAQGAALAKLAWMSTTEAIASDLSGLVSFSEDRGYELQRSVSEGSPGPTYWIRKKWAFTTDNVKEGIKSLTGEAELTGNTLQLQLAEKYTRHLDRIVEPIESMKDVNEKGGKIKDLQSSLEVQNQAMLDKAVMAGYNLPDSTKKGIYQAINLVSQGASKVSALPLIAKGREMVDTHEDRIEKFKNLEQYGATEWVGQMGRVGGTILEYVEKGLPVLATGVLPGVLAGAGVGSVATVAAQVAKQVAIEAMSEKIPEEVNKRAGKLIGETPTNLAAGFMLGAWAGSSDNKLLGAADAVKEKWRSTTESIASDLSGLVSFSEDRGYELQKAISEGSPGTTKWIRKHWEKTTIFVGDSINSLVDVAGHAGSGILKRFSKWSGKTFSLFGATVLGFLGRFFGASKKIQQTTVQQQQEVVRESSFLLTVLHDTWSTLTGFVGKTIDTLTLSGGKLSSQIALAVDEGFVAIDDRLAYLQAKGTTNLNLLFEPGMNELSDSFSRLGGDIWDFGKRAGKALLTLNFGELSDAVGDFWGNFKFAAQGIIAGFNNMSLSAIAFGLFAVGSVSPLVLILGGIAFTVFVLLTNFLGLRTILKGIVQIILGVDRTLYALLKGAIDMTKAFGKIIKGVFLAFKGDTTVLKEGIEDFKRAWAEMIKGMGGGLKTIARGFGTVFKGIGTGINQVIKPLGISIAGIAIPVRKIVDFFKDGEKAGEKIATVLVDSFKLVGRAAIDLYGTIKNFLVFLWDGFKKGIEKLQQMATSSVGNVKDFIQSFNFESILMQLKVLGNFISQWISNIPYSIKTITPVIYQALISPFEYLYSFIRGFIGRISQEFTSEFVESVKQGMNRALSQFSGMNVFGKLFDGGKGQDFKEIDAEITRLTQKRNRAMQSISNFSSPRVKDKANFIVAESEKRIAELQKNRSIAEQFYTPSSRIKTAWFEITEFIKTLWTKASELVKNKLESISQASTDATLFVEQKWKQLVDKLSVNTDAFFGNLQKLPIWFSEAFNEIGIRWEKFQSLLKSGTFRIDVLGFDLIQKALDSIGYLLLDLSQKIKSIPLQDFVAYMGMVFLNLGSFIDIVKQKWVAFTNWLSGWMAGRNILDEIAMWFIGIGQKVKIDKLQSFFTYVGIGFYQLSAILEFISNQWGNFVRWLGNTKSIGKGLSGLSVFSSNIGQSIGSAVDWIKGKWQGFVDTFKGILLPIVDFALGISDGLIGALNHHPTVVIPEAWRKAIEFIKGLFEGLVEKTQAIGKTIVEIFQGVTNKVGNLFSGFKQGFGSHLMPFEGMSPAVQGLIQELGRLGEVLHATLSPIVGWLSQIKTEANQSEQALQGISTTGRIIGEVLAVAFNAMAGAVNLTANTLTVALATIREVSAPVMQLAESFMKAASSVTKFTTKFVGSFAAQVSPTIKELVPLVGKMLRIFSRIGAVAGAGFAAIAAVPLVPLFIDIAAKVALVSGAITGLIALFKEMIPPITSAEQAGKMFGEGVGKAIDIVLIGLKKIAEVAVTIGDFLTAPLKIVDAAWEKTGDRIGNVFRKLTGRSKQVGEQLQANLSEASPGPTWQIRQSWGKTEEFVLRSMILMANQSEKSGEKILANMLVASESKKMQGNLKGLGSSLRGLTLSAGSALSNFAPQLAMPLFILNDFIDLFGSLKEIFPEITKVIGTQGSLIGATLNFISSTAAKAWTSLIVPLIPFLPYILGIALGVFLLYQAFQNNFLGIRDLVMGIFNGIKDFFTLLFTGVWDAFAWVFTVLEQEGYAIARTFDWVLGEILSPLRTLFDALGYKQGNRYGMGGFLQTVVDIILIPLRIITATVGYLIRGISAIIQLIIRLGGGLVGLLLLPITLTFATIQGIAVGIGAIYDWLTQVFDILIRMPFDAAWNMTMAIASALNKIGYSIYQTFWFVLEPISWVLKIIVAIASSIVIIPVLIALAIPVITALGSAILSFVIPPLLNAIFAVTFFAMDVVLAFGAAIPLVISFGIALWTALAPIMPIIIGVGLAIGLLVLLFKTNFLNLGTIIAAPFVFLWEIIKTLFGGIWQVITEVFGAIGTSLQEVWRSLVDTLGMVFGPIFDLVSQIFGKQNQKNAFDMLGLIATIGRMVGTGMVVPFKIVGWILIGIIKVVEFLAKLIIGIGGAILGVIYFPFWLVLSVINLIKKAIDWVVSGFVFVGQALANVLMNPFKAVWNFIQWIANNAGALLASKIPVIGFLFKPAPQPQEVPKYASGGLVTGQGTSTGDRVLAAVSPGEFVVNAQATQSNFPLLNLLNQGIPVIPGLFQGLLGLAIGSVAETLGKVAGTVGVPLSPLPPTITPVPKPVATPETQETEAKYEINLNFGDIIVQGATGEDAAQDFLKVLESPQAQRRIRTMLRDLVEKMK